VIETLDQPEFEAVIVDLRFNTGGDLGTAQGFFEGLAAHPDLAAGGRLAVIVGQATFSAGLFHAAQLRASGLATLVGREPGDRLDYWSEGGNIRLPNSGHTLHFSNGYHSYSGRPDSSVEKIFRSLSVESLAPDIEIRMTSGAYQTGKDPLLDAALEGIRSSFPE
jgi:C-terminal processing protease CtpA/Prc